MRVCVHVRILVCTDFNIGHCVRTNYFDFILFNVRTLPQIVVLLVYVCGSSRPAVTLTNPPMAMNMHCKQTSDDDDGGCVSEITIHYQALIITRRDFFLFELHLFSDKLFQIDLNITLEKP